MNEFNAKLASLGVALLVEPAYAADPEQTLLQAVGLFSEDRKVLSLVLGWIALHGDLLNIERLRTLAKSLNAEELAWLGGVAATAVENDRRWQTVCKFLEEKLGKGDKHVVTSNLDALLAKKNGADPHFARFGFLIPKVKPSLPKKFFQRQEIFKRNPWLRFRALFGANWRADIAWRLIARGYFYAETKLLS